MEDDNPHGAGVAWEQDGAIRFVKGLSAKDIFQMQEDKVMSYPYLMHYRWATHGARVKELTHPFVIGPRALMGELSGSANAVLIHNGTWDAYEKRAGEYINSGNYEMPLPMLNKMSDTAVAAWLAAFDPDVLDEVLWATAVAEIKGGKMEITTRGEWHDKDGNWYSNLNWVESKRWSMYSHDDWDYEQWQDWYNNSGYKASPYKSDVPLANKSKTDAKPWSVMTTKERHTFYLKNPGADNRSIYDRYIDRVVCEYVIPFSVRGNSDLALTYEQYVNKYGAQDALCLQEENIIYDSVQSSTINSNRTQDSKSISWKEYLDAKYGPEAAKEIENTFFPSDNESDCQSEPSCLGEKDGSFCQVGQENEPEPDIDPDCVSEDFETVNEILRRQMANLW